MTRINFDKKRWIVLTLYLKCVQPGARSRERIADDDWPAQNQIYKMQQVQNHCWMDICKFLK